IQNALLNNVSVKFFIDNILKPKAGDEVYDVIVSNPPYVLQSEKEIMDKHVLEHEPHAALFVPDEDALIFYKAILIYAYRHLKFEGRIFFEINDSKANEIKKLLNSF